MRRSDKTALAWGVTVCALPALIGTVIVALVSGGTESPWLLLLAALFFWMTWDGATSLQEWYSRIPGEDLKVLTDSVQLGGRTIGYREIVKLVTEALVTEKRLNFISSGRDIGIRAQMVLGSGEQIRLRGGQGPVSRMSGNWGENSAKELISKLDAIEQRISH